MSLKRYEKWVLASLCVLMALVLAAIVLNGGGAAISSGHGGLSPARMDRTWWTRAR